MSLLNAFSKSFRMHFEGHSNRSSRLSECSSHVLVFHIRHLIHLHMLSTEITEKMETRVELELSTGMTPAVPHVPAGWT
eukprot:9944897-Karenia_brevis.AAC.1